MSNCYVLDASAILALMFLANVNVSLAYKPSRTHLGSVYQ
jgi:PIN domain nuclease of toxin-antitoxin system